MAETGFQWGIGRARQWARVVGRASAMVATALMLAGCATNMGGNVTNALGEQTPALPDGKPQKPVRIGMLLSLSGYGRRRWPRRA